MEFISDKELISRFCFDNPWWGKSGQESPSAAPVPSSTRIFFQAFSDCAGELAAGEILLLAGSLLAGKTVMMRQRIAQLIERGAAPESVLYCSLASPGIASVPPERLLKLFMDQFGNGPEREVTIFVDEVQYLRDWQIILTALAKDWPRAHFICAVSSNAPSLITGKAPAGGGVKTFVLPPMTFLEHLRFAGAEKELLGASAGNGQASMTVSPDALQDLNTEFIRYVNFGGFLDVDAALHQDLASLSGISDTRELSRLLALLALNTAREVNIEELTKAIGVAKNTLRKYLDHLEQAFLIRRLPRVDKTARRFQRAVAFKVYLTQPSLYAAMFGPVAPDDDAFPRLAETALVTQWLGTGGMDNQAYASWKGGGIDLLSMQEGVNSPEHVFELDWSDSYAGGGKGPKTLADFVRATNPAAKATILTRRTARSASMQGVDISLVPLALYAYWISLGFFSRAVA
ncbi:MAG: AAA family ATPase [Rhodospirillales bacterium]